MDFPFSRGTQLFRALSDETRVRIVHLLSCEEMCVCDLQKYFDLTQPTLSHHLASLRLAGLVTSRRKGKWTYYSIDRTTVRFLTGFLDSILLPSEECFCKELKRSAVDADPCL